MKKLINKIKSIFRKESEIDKMYRVLTGLCDRYNHVCYITCEIKVYRNFHQIDGTYTGKKTYRVYTENLGSFESTSLDLALEKVEIALIENKIEPF